MFIESHCIQDNNGGTRNITIKDFLASESSIVTATLPDDRSAVSKMDLKKNFNF